jgi:hypothetical protein
MAQWHKIKKDNRKRDKIDILSCAKGKQFDGTNGTR